MRGLLNILKSRTFLLIVGFLILIALVLALGAFLEWSWTIRLLGVIGVMLLCIVVLAFNFVRENRSSDEIERSIKKQAEQQLISTRPDKKGEIEELQRQLEQAIEKLKQSKLGRGQRGRAALYALPWYLFMGPPGAGKTTAIVNSGLNFPIGTDSVRGVGGTRNCDWFFTDSAILLDTAGRYMTEQEDTEEWLAFLDTLSQHRPDRPINGVIVGMPLPDLALASLDEIEWHADNIRRRSDELVKHLGVKFPVYLVFTKSDMLQGFVEFFGEYSRRDREQIWGATFDAEQQETGDLRGVFEQEFDRLVGAVQNKRGARLSRPMKREERQKVYAFPLQLASVKDNLAHFVGRLFQPNPYQESPTFRGFYFTSGTQEGVPLDRVILTLARQFDLPTTGLHQLQADMETKSYFIKDLFTDVVVPDQYMVRRTSKAVQRGSLQRVGTLVAAAVLLVLFTLGASQAVIRGKLNLNEARNVALNTNTINWNDRNATITDLERLDALRAEVQDLGRTDWLSLGLNRNGTVREPARMLYLSHARQFIESFPLTDLERRIEQAVRQGQVEETGREDLTQDLKAYLLLTNHEESTERLEEDANYNFLIRHLTNQALDEIEPRATAMPAGELRARIEPQVTAYVDALRRNPSLAFGSDVNLVRNARQRIRQPPSIDNLYQRIKLDGLDVVQPFRLSDVPGRYRYLLTTSAEVPGFFTQRGYRTYVIDKIEEMSADPTGEDWVMGLTEETDLTNLGTPDEVATGLENRYFADYAREWNNFLQSVRVQNFSDLRSAARGISELTDQNESPILYLLARVTEETRFESAMLDQATELGEEVAEGVATRAENAARRALRLQGNARRNLNGENELHPVDQRFQWLHALKADQGVSGGADARLYQALNSLSSVGSTLEGIAGDDFQAAEYAAQVLQANGGDLDRELRSINSALGTFNGEAKRNLFEVPVLQAWGRILGTAQRYLNDRWRTVVYDPFQNQFASRYPFDATSDQDAFISDVETFFNQQSGAVATFLEELEPYIGRDIERPRTWNGGIQISRPASAAIQQAQSIANNAFSGGRIQVAFELQPEQPRRSANAPVPSQVTLRLLGQEDQYNLGFQSWRQYEWPGRPDAMLSILTQTGEEVVKRYDGEWALFRLLRDARITRQTSSQYQMQVDLERPGQYTFTAIYNLRTRNANNPFDNPRGFFDFRPPQTLN